MHIKRRRRREKKNNFLCNLFKAIINPQPPRTATQIAISLSLSPKYLSISKREAQNSLSQQA